MLFKNIKSSKFGGFNWHKYESELFTKMWGTVTSLKLLTGNDSTAPRTIIFGTQTDIMTTIMYKLYQIEIIGYYLKVT